MEIIDLRYFEATAAAGSFAAAGRLLNLNASSICRRLNRFEDEIGVTLFERRPTGVRLTPGGRAVLDHVRTALAHLSNVAATAGRSGVGEVGSIRLAVRMPPVGEHLLGVLHQWRTALPDVIIQIHEMNEREIGEALVQGRIDAAIVRRNTLWVEAEAETIARERVLVATPINHPLSNLAEIRWTSFAGEKVLVQEWDESCSARELYSTFVGSAVRFEAHPASKQSILALVAAGYGVTLVTQSQAQVTVPGVIYRPIAEDSAWVEVDVAWLPYKENAVLGRFLSHLRSYRDPKLWASGG